MSRMESSESASQGDNTLIEEDKDNETEAISAPRPFFTPSMLLALAHLVPTTTMPSILPFGEMRAPIDMTPPSMTNARVSVVPTTKVVVTT